MVENKSIWLKTPKWVKGKENLVNKETGRLNPDIKSDKQLNAIVTLFGNKLFIKINLIIDKYLKFLGNE